MKAMLFAAGLGTRLRPITNTIPKALVEINGVTLLERAIRHLQSAGVDEIIVNTHHFAEQIAAFLRAKNNFGLRVEISFEAELLDTGGGLKKAAWLFDDGKPFFVHNADVISQLELTRMYRFHVEHKALATLAVKPRRTKRQLLFDEKGRLCGRQEIHSPLEGGRGGVGAADDVNQVLNSNSGAISSDTPLAPLKGGVKNSPLEGGQGGVDAHHDANQILKPNSNASLGDTPLKGGMIELAFDGIHVISPALLAMMEEESAFSIIDTYLRLAAAGEKILAFRSDGHYWRDVGKLAELEEIAQELAARTTV